LTGPDRHRRTDSSSPGVSGPSALEVSRARLPRVCLTRHLPSSGIRTLLTVCFSRHPPALFHAGRAPGLLPSGLLPFTEPSVPLGPGPLRDVGAEPPRSSRTSRSDPSAPNLAFEALLSAKIRHPRAPAFTSPRRPLPSWVSRPLGDSPSNRPAARRNGSPHELARSPGVELNPRPYRQALSRVLTTSSPAGLFRDCRPFWPSRTSSPSRRFNARPCLAYGFARLFRRCCQPLKQPFGMSRDVYRSSAVLSFGAP